MTSIVSGFFPALKAPDGEATVRTRESQRAVVRALDRSDRTRTCNPGFGGGFLGSAHVCSRLFMRFQPCEITLDPVRWVGKRVVEPSPYGAAQTAVACILIELAELFVTSTIQPDPVLLLSDMTTRTVSAEKIL